MEVWGLWYIVFNATFNNISVTKNVYHGGQFFLLVEETRVPRENHQPVTSHRQTLSHNVVPVWHLQTFLVLNICMNNAAGRHRDTSHHHVYITTLVIEFHTSGSGDVHCITLCNVC